MAIPCDYRGSFVEKLECAPCKRSYDKFVCDKHQFCTIIEMTNNAKKQHGQIKSCELCHERAVSGKVVGVEQNERLAARRAATGSAESTQLVEPDELLDLCTQHVPQGDYETNGSIVIYEGKRLMAYQYNETGICISRFHAGWEPINPMEDAVVGIPRCTENARGMKNPRLFIHDRLLMLSYIGIARNGTETNFVCEVQESGYVVSHIPVFFPGVPQSGFDIVFFSDGDAVKAITSCSPLIVYRVFNGNAQLETVSYHTGSQELAHLFGGSPPIIHGDLRLFFVSRSATSCRSGNNTSVALIAFDGLFKIAYRSKLPLIAPNLNDGDRILRPFGATVDGDKVWLSIGLNGKRIRMAAIAIEKLNTLVRGSQDVIQSEPTADAQRGND
ncbi:hypothetical protein KC887_00320 [Candidatus Kaiserbacteria bacterium]|nr:hypothetical protein [Candidatus Kaiserbacteria bacterium]